MKKQATAEQKAAAEARRAKFRAIAKQIADMTDAQRAELSARCPVIVTVEGRALSGKNSLLVAFQCPTATMVGGFRQWIKAGRCVRKGQRGLMIWVPTGGKKEDGASGEKAPQTDAEETRFVMGTVFDVSQTRALDEAPDLAETVAAQPLALMAPAAEPEAIEVAAEVVEESAEVDGGKVVQFELVES